VCVAAGEGARPALLAAHEARGGPAGHPSDAGPPGLVVSVVLQRAEGEEGGGGGAGGGRPEEGGVSMVEAAADGGCLCCAEGDAGLGPALRVALGLGLPGSDTSPPVDPAPPLPPGGGRLILVEAAGASPWALAGRLQEICLGWNVEVKLCTVTPVVALAALDDCCCPEGKKDALELRCDEAEAADYFLGSRSVARDLLQGLNPRARELDNLGPALWEAVEGDLKTAAGLPEGGFDFSFEGGECSLEPAHRFRRQLETLPSRSGSPPGGAPPGWRAFQSRRPLSLERFCRLLNGCRPAKHNLEAVALQGDSSDILRCRGGLSRDGGGGSACGGLFSGIIRLRGLVWLDTNHLRARFWSQAREVARVGDAGPWWAARAQGLWPSEQGLQKRIRGLMEAPTSEWAGTGDRRNEVWAFCQDGSTWEALSEALGACCLTGPEWAAYKARLRGYCDPSGPLAVASVGAACPRSRKACSSEEGRMAKKAKVLVKSKFF